MLLLILWMSLSACCGGCGSPVQPYLSQSRLERGFVLVLTGIEGRSRFNEAIADGLANGGCPYAIEIYDWTSSWMPLVDQNSPRRNQNKAYDVALRVARYQLAYPDRPVFLVGQSGGGGMAIWTAERLHGRRVDGIVLLAASVSPSYRLDRALAASRQGIVNFYSERDMFLLGFGTTVFRTMDGSHSKSAGMVGFAVPPPPAAYGKLFQVPFHSRMSASGHYGLHVTSGAEGFVREYVTPILMAGSWSRRSIDAAVHNAIERTSRETTSHKPLATK